MSIYKILHWIYNLIIVTALLFKEKMHYLSFVTPWNAVIVIFIFGIILF